MPFPIKKKNPLTDSFFYYNNILQFEQTVCFSLPYIKIFNSLKWNFNVGITKKNPTKTIHNANTSGIVSNIPTTKIIKEITLLKKGILS